MSKIFLILINFYQTFISFDNGVLSVLAPGGACKYFPSCSEYMKQQILEKGALSGFILGCQRIWRCR